MALTVPNVEYDQLPGKSHVALNPRFITIHTMVGTLEGTRSYFAQPLRPYSHFGLGGDGYIVQWQDLRFRAASDYHGNPYTISIECEDHSYEFPEWSGSDVPNFTKRQIEALIVLVSWLCARFDIPTTAVSSSCLDQRGVAWHRHGIDPWRRDGCIRWSSVYGKACPGNRRIEQIKNIIIPALNGEVDMGQLEDALVFTGYGLQRPEQTWKRHEKLQIEMYRAIERLKDLVVTKRELTEILASELGSGEVDPEDVKGVITAAVKDSLPVALTEANMTPAAIAEAVADALPKEQALQIVHELGRRLSEDEGMD